jgi:hypothetical protein
MRRLLVLVVVVVVVGGIGAYMAAERPKLDDARAATTRRWTALRAPLQERYQKLDAALAALVAAGGKRNVTEELTDRLEAWRPRARVPDGRADVDAEAHLANELEGLGARVAALATGSARLKANEALGAAVAGYASTTPPPEAVRAYNRAVRQYQRTRTSAFRELVARVLGFDERPALVIA